VSSGRMARARPVFDEMTFGPANLGLEEDVVQERAEQALEFFGLDRYRGTHPYRLSLPLRKLVAMAAIYAMRPKVMVLDEPTTGQDHIGMNTVRRLIEKLREEGDTIVLVTHDMVLVAQTADRLLVLCDSELIGDGAPREIFSGDEMMARTNLRPPQITQLSRRIFKPGLPEAALRVSELAEPLAKTL